MKYLVIVTVCLLSLNLYFTLAVLGEMGKTQDAFNNLEFCDIP